MHDSRARPACPVLLPTPLWCTGREGGMGQQTVVVVVVVGTWGEWRGLCVCGQAPAADTPPHVQFRRSCAHGCAQQVSRSSHSGAAACASTQQWQCPELTQRPWRMILRCCAARPVRSRPRQLCCYAATAVRPQTTSAPCRRRAEGTMFFEVEPRTTHNNPTKKK